MIIRKPNIDEEPPMDMLLLADPSRILVEEYMQRGECFVAESDGYWDLCATADKTR